MNELNKIELKMNDLYKEYIKLNCINPKTGILKERNKKLATLPYIGSKYGEKRKILFIGMDIGCDEREGITSIIQRRKDIEDVELEKLNPHIAGTYFLSLYFLRKEEEYRKIWNEVSQMQITCQMILRNNKDQLGLGKVSNCLSYVALTNYFKYVTINREKRAGGQDRNYQNKDSENKLLWNEIEILEPDLIFVQSQSFRDIKIENKKKIEIIVGNHPASREKGTRIPSTMITLFNRG